MTLILTDRRSFLGGLGALFIAPALVRVENIMPIKPTLVPQPAILRLAAINTRACYSWSAIDLGDAFFDPVRDMHLMRFDAAGDGFENPPDYDHAEVIKVMRLGSGKLDFTDNVKLLEWRDNKGRRFLEKKGVLVPGDLS